jgi:polysaccharide pyruvyl transferase WcaK-like protein
MRRANCNVGCRPKLRSGWASRCSDRALICQQYRQRPRLDNVQSGKTILVLAGDHHGNLGDKAIVTATAELLRSELDRPRIYLVGNGSPAYWSGLGVELIPNGVGGWPLLRRAAKDSDLVLCGGGGLFQDDDSRVKMPYWAARIGALRPFARRMAGFSIGAGPLRYALSRSCAAYVLRQLDSMSVRDELARETLAPLSDKPIALVPDPALLLEPSPVDPEPLLVQHGIPVDGRPLIGVAPRRWFHLRSHFIPHKYAHRYRLRPIPGAAEVRELVALLAAVLDRLVAEHGAHIVFLPTYNLVHEGDDAISAQIAERMRERAASLVRIDDPRVYKRVTQRLSVMLAGRMHAAILAAAGGTPVIGLSYNQKFQGFLKLIDPQAVAVDIREFVANKAVADFATRLEALLGIRDPYAERIAALRQRVSAYTRELLVAAGLR